MDIAISPLVTVRPLCGALLSISFLAACSSSGGSQSTGTSGGGGSGGGSTSTGGGGSASTTSTGTPATYEEQVQAGCTQFCDVRAALAKTKMCTPESLQGCVKSCIALSAKPEVKACTNQFLALVQCRTDKTDAPSCYCTDTAMGDGTGVLACNNCANESNQFQICSGL